MLKKRKVLVKLSNIPDSDEVDFSKELIRVDFFDKLEAEVDELVSKAKSYRRSILGSIGFKIRPQENAEELSGETMGMTTEKAQMLMKKLRQNPMDFHARAELVDHFLRRDSAAKENILWEVLKNALLACSLDDISTDCLNNAVLIQSNYMRVAISGLMNESEKIGVKIRDEKSGNSNIVAQLTKQRDIRIETARFMKTCLEALKGSKAEKGIHINLKDFLIRDEETTSKQDKDKKDSAKKGEKAKGPEYKFNEILKISVSLPAISKRMLAIADKVNAAFPASPVGYIHKTRISKTQSKILGAAYLKEKSAPSDGINIGKLKQGRQDSMNQALSSISKGIDIVPEIPRDKADGTCIKELGVILIEINQAFPQFNVVKRAQGAVALLSKISDDPQAVEIQGILNKTIEGFANPVTQGKEALEGEEEEEKKGRGKSSQDEKEQDDDNEKFRGGITAYNAEKDDGDDM